MTAQEAVYRAARKVGAARVWSPEGRAAFWSILSQTSDFNDFERMRDLIQSRKACTYAHHDALARG